MGIKSFHRLFTRLYHVPLLPPLWLYTSSHRITIHTRCSRLVTNDPQKWKKKNSRTALSSNEKSWENGKMWASSLSSIIIYEAALEKICRFFVAERRIGTMKMDFSTWRVYPVVFIGIQYRYVHMQTADAALKSGCQTSEDRGAEPPANKRTTLTMENCKKKKVYLNDGKNAEFEGWCVMLASCGGVFFFSKENIVE